MRTSLKKSLSDIVTALNNRRFNTKTPGATCPAEKRARPPLLGPTQRTWARGDGCYLYDVDGNEYIDYLNNYGSLIHGHAYRPIVEAANEQLLNGTVLGSAAEPQTRLAKLLCERIPSVDMIRFCNSGTEATMMATRAARAHTGRDMLIKMEGGYHGFHDFVSVNITPSGVAEGRLPTQVEWRGVPASVANDVLIARFNDLDSVAALLDDRADQVAAVISEPMLGPAGMIPPEEGFLTGLRDLTAQSDVLLIFDEILTYRLNHGGLQALQAVEPDITALGKVIGGGLPVGAFGGSKEIMSYFDPDHPKTVIHSGTFSGNNITMAAGIAAMEDYDQATIDRINGLGDRLREGLESAFHTAGIHGRATGIGSLTNIHFGEPGLSSVVGTAEPTRHDQMARLVHLELLNRGIHIGTRGIFTISTPMTESHIDQSLQAFAGALEILKPIAVELAAVE